jgi:hypothetical protein
MKDDEMQEEEKPGSPMQVDAAVDEQQEEQQQEKQEEQPEEQQKEQQDGQPEETKESKEETNEETNEVTKEELPRIPLLHRELTEQETKARKIKERTLVLSARYFANREGAHGFFASTLQDYDDCTIVLVEI